MGIWVSHQGKSQEWGVQAGKKRAPRGEGRKGGGGSAGAGKQIHQVLKTFKQGAFNAQGGGKGGGKRGNETDPMSFADSTKAPRYVFGRGDKKRVREG